MSTRSITPTVAPPVPAVTPKRDPVLQRACDCGQHTIGGAECEECKKKGKNTLQRRADGFGGPPMAPSIVRDVLASPGQPLDDETRAFFEPRFGQDFSRVRVHRDAKAAESARAVDALAYTVGNNLVFGAGRYTPSTVGGKKLLAHELTHVVQQHQDTASLQCRLEVGAHDHFEDEAERIAEGVASGAEQSSGNGTGFSSSHPGPVLQRATAESAPAIAENPAASSRTAMPLLVEDDARDLKAGQMRKSEFLAKLQISVCSAADEELKAVGRTTQTCPYLARWMKHLAGKDSRFVERALRKYAPDSAGATKAEDYIAPVTTRVRHGVARWAKTGEITEVPDELRGQLLAASVVGAMESVVSGIGTAIGRAASAIAGGMRKAASAIGKVFTKERAGGTREVDSAEEIQSRLGQGRPLETSVRARMETAFEDDFSYVRVHDDQHSSALSSRLNARAFAIGDDVAFGHGEYQPGTPIGDALIAHELAHVIQQRTDTGAIAQKAESAADYDALEEDADLSAVGAVIRLWGGTKAGLGALKQRSFPSLRSGLRLQRCGGSHPELQMTSGRHVGDIPGSVNNLKEEVLAAMDRLHILWAMPNADYNAEYPAVSKLPLGTTVPVDAIPKTIAAVGRLNDPTLNPAVANPVLGTNLAGTVGKGRFNKREDILALQDSLRAEFVLPKNEYDAEHAAVSALATPTVADNVIPKTIAAIARMKREFVAGTIRRDVFAGTRAVTETQHRHIEAQLNPQLILAPPPPAPVGAPPPPPVLIEPDPMTGKGPGGAFETEMFKMLKENFAKWGGEFRAIKAEKGQPAFPIASANNIARAAQGEVERYYAPYIRTATRAPGEKYHVGAYSLTEKLGDESTRPITPGARRGWMDYFMTLRSPNCRVPPCGQKILDDHKYLGSRDRAERDRVRDLYLSDPARLTDLDDTIHGWPAEAGTGTVFIQPYQHVKGDVGRRNRWKLFLTLIHEMMHIVSHPNFSLAADRIGGTARKILVEGFAEVFVREIWAEGGALKSRLPGPEMSGVREQVEGASYDYDAALVPEPTYYDQIAQASEIDKEVGRPNSKAAYFTGHVELLGLGAGTRTEAGPLAGIGMYEPSDDPDAQVIVIAAGDTYANVLARTGASPGSLIDDATSAVLAPAAPIAPGARIRVPGIRWVRAISHDTLGAVAKQHHVPVADLARANGFPPGAPPATPLVVGKRILIPIHKNFP